MTTTAASVREVNVMEDSEEQVEMLRHDMRDSLLQQRELWVMVALPRGTVWDSQI